jgi:hypothetical protein
MKRIKKFVKDNKTEIIVGTGTAMLGVIIGMLYVHRKDMQGMMIHGAETWMGSDGIERLAIQHVNGKIVLLPKIEEVVAA